MRVVFKMRISVNMKEQTNEIKKEKYSNIYKLMKT